MRKNCSILNKAAGIALAAVMMLGFTSCEDILGHWERPTGAAVTPSDSETPEEPAVPTVVDLSMLDCAGNVRDKRWTANCYMVHTAGDYKLPLVYGNAIKDGAANTAAYTGVSGQLETFLNHASKPITDPFIKNNKDASDNNITVTSAELLWQDAVGLITKVGISEDGDYLTLTVGKDAATQEGNAVVAAKDGNGDIVWSWHIWVTTQTFAESTLAAVTTTTDTSTGTQGVDWQIYKVTPVNLGWVATGGDGKQGYNTYYQWGRKDAFIPGTGSGNTNHTVYDINGTDITTSALNYEGSTTATIADNIKNPTTHYYNSTTYGPCNTQYCNMWDAQQTSTGNSNIKTATVKTVYDPCPAGFCVPTGNLYYFMTGGGQIIYADYTNASWDDTNKGMIWKPTTPQIYFPASGRRNCSTGSLSNVGSNGYYSPASLKTSSQVHYLYFDSTKWKWSFYNTADSKPVRAVAEE